jgi:hypothetical protein
MSAALSVVEDSERTSLMQRWHAPAFNPTHAASVLRALHDGITLREHCRTMRDTDPSYPNASTVYAWATANAGGFSVPYAIARRAQAQHWAEEILEISEDGRNDWMERRRLDGTIIKTVDSECVQRSKLRVETRKWLLSKLAPEFADRVQHQTLGANGQPVDPPSAVTPIDLSSMLKGWKPREV